MFLQNLAQRCMKTALLDSGEVKRYLKWNKNWCTVNAQFFL